MLRRVSWGGMWRAVVRFRRFPAIGSGTALMNTFNLRMPALLLAVYFGPAVAGCFALSQRVFSLPSSVIGESVAQVYFGEVAATMNRDAGGLMVLFRGTMRRMFLLGLPLMLTAMAAGWFLFPLIFGRNWREAGIFVVALAPMALAQFTAACADSTLLVLERQDLALYREVLRTGLLLSGILAAYLLFPLALGGTDTASAWRFLTFTQNIGLHFGETFPLRIHAFLEDVTKGVPREHLRSSGRDALATMEYIFAAIESYEEGGELVRPHALPTLHGDPMVAGI